ncbi:ThiF family adenylyltransferase [Flavobacterium sp. SORGH_AS_0622]|uniref:ThiF family adenylyltransferase n=1 Tax=Flavobacterium sp. SORGH_AS_0622 TaxID=3041772 RepID=UPI00277E1BE1|nr:ThiF family adenylyltransferase [Flavobacterium sp. SORGH_AS_0622]MDQ1166413.1 hypothetical protein [Flavobacterium sp. SORGH_AS_0622]
MEKFSRTLQQHAENIENPDLLDSLKSLENYIGNSTEILDWGHNKVAVALEIKIDLPSLGNFANLDIRATEPVILVFDKINYPISAPKVYTDRLDFPKNNLAHLYVAVNNRPPALCYIRGNADEWYSNKRIDDLLIRIRNWFRDAATGELTQNGEQFEPLRLEGYSGSIMYDYNTMIEVIEGKTNLQFEGKYSVALFERNTFETKTSYKFSRLITSKNALEVLKDVDEERKKEKSDTTKKKYYYAVIMWTEGNETFPEFKVNIPSDWEDFKSFCSFYKINVSDFENFITTTSDLNEYIHFPVIIGIRRPNQIIGYSSNVEFINLDFKLDTSDFAQGKITNNVPIKMLKHNQPLTNALAVKISGNNLNIGDRNLIFGCGALGSKIIMHFARSGHTNMTILDPDDLSPHNLVRHALFSDAVGENKAEALAEKINELFPYRLTIGGPSLKDGWDKSETFSRYKWIFDFTASNAFFNKLIVLENANQCNVASASISNFGNLGIMYKEGLERNPRIDDLQNHLYSLSEHDKDIEQWLSAEQMAVSANNLIIQVGVGCNSETTVLADDRISSHASFFSGALKKEVENISQNGKIYLNRINDLDEYRIETQVINVEPFKVLKICNNDRWTIRMKGHIEKHLLHKFKTGGTVETGGVFLGSCNYKTKTIHITGIINAPLDSKGSSVEFIRGVEGLSQQIAEISKKSGGQIGYIGEWHTHPSGPNILSVQDLQSIELHKKECSLLHPPLPVLVTLITPTGMFPYMY